MEMAQVTMKTEVKGEKEDVFEEAVLTTTASFSTQQQRVYERHGTSQSRVAIDDIVFRNSSEFRNQCYLLDLFNVFEKNTL